MNPDSPCTATVTPGEHGGLTVQLHVPTYQGGATFTLHAERDDADGDWRVFIPWTATEDTEPVLLADGHECTNGILYLGAPDAAAEAEDTSELRECPRCGGTVWHDGERWSCQDCAYAECVARVVEHADLRAGQIAYAAECDEHGELMNGEWHDRPIVEAALAAHLAQPRTCPGDHHRPDDDPVLGDRCKDCGVAITWTGPNTNDWSAA